MSLEHPIDTHERPAPRARRRETELHRYRLTFDANPKELARREAGGSHVALLWSRRTGRAAVVVEEDASGELVELEVEADENPLELYQHPYVYIPARGHPGRRFAQTAADLPEAA
jgi:hypothetical protein